jgi:uncharacterized iron-regulated protein
MSPQPLRRLPSRAAALLVALASVALVACGGAPARPAPPPTVPIDAVRGAPAFQGDDGRALTFEEIVSIAAQSDIVVLGERHDDAWGHSWQLAFFEALAARAPGAVLSLEMLARDEQLLVEDYLEGLIDGQALALRVHPGRTADDPVIAEWSAWYLPLVDAAREAGVPVVAANAPRRYVSAAREQGYARLEQVEGPRRGFFDVPEWNPTGDYEARFREAMGQHGGEGHGAIDPETIWGWYAAQLVWDRTMAGSVAAAREGGRAPVVLIAGAFHVDFDGGTVQYLRRLRPNDSVLTVSVLEGGAETAVDALRDEDRGRALILVYGVTP